MEKDFRYSCVYQIYPKSFQDSNGDGIGDLAGVIQRLDYIKGLGVDYIWLTPFFTSPQNDNGYDVADYCEIDPVYGTMRQFEELVKGAEERGMGIMLDMVFNHTSTAHTWFQKALQGDAKYKEYYIWQAPKKDGSLPTNWESKFGGPVWEYVPALKQYYLHLFDKTQADLNWENPLVRKEIKEVLHFWMNKGVKGFRFDVVNLISKPENYQDDTIGDGRRFYTDGIKVSAYLKEICEELNQKGMLTVGEMSSTSIENCIRYSNPEEGQLTMCFNFHHLKVDYKDQNKWKLQTPDFMQLKKLINEWQIGMQEGNGWNAVFWSNHDQPRVVSRFGNDDKYWRESAKMLAAVMYLTRGTPYIYQGEELGMTNAYFKSIEEYRDVESINYYSILKNKGIPKQEILEILRQRSRDNSRTPMQWSQAQQGGFTNATPWLSVNKNYGVINAENQQLDKDSILEWYKKLIALRKNSRLVAEGKYIPLLEEHPKAFAYQRVIGSEKMLVIANFFEQETEIEIKAETGFVYHMGNYDKEPLENKMLLKPFEVRIYLK